MTPLRELERYIYTYHKGVHIIDNGFCCWLIAGTLQQQAKIAEKAIRLQLRVEFNKENATDIYKSLRISLL